MMMSVFLAFSLATLVVVAAPATVMDAAAADTPLSGVLLAFIVFLISILSTYIFILLYYYTLFIN